jgi:predicted membrane protein
LCFAQLTLRSSLAGDFTVSWLAAQYLFAGKDPYQVVQPLGDYPFNAPFFYPLTAALAALPFSWMPPELAGAVFFGLGSALLAHAVLQSGSHRLPLFISTPFLVSAALAQWSPLILAAGLLPAFSWLLACKPNTGIPMFISRPTKGKAVAIAGFLLLSLGIRFTWPVEWLAIVNAPSFHQAPIWTNPAGWVLLLSLLRIATAGGRLLFFMALLPQSLWFYDQLVLWALPRNRHEGWLLTVLSWLAYGLWRLNAGWAAPASGENNPGNYILFFIYLPALAMVLLPEDFAVQAYNILKGGRIMNRGQLVLGLILVVLGVLFLVGTVFHVDVGAFCWPIGFILVGTWLVLRPRLTQGNGTSDVVLLGDLRRRGKWTVRDGEIWLGVADVDLDFTMADLPPGETRLKFYGFVGDVDLVFPATVGVAVSAVGFVVDTDLFGHDYKTFLTPVEAASPDFSTAACKVRIEMIGFITDLKVKKI